MKREFWFLVGSQCLYGDEVFSNTVYLLQVEEGYHYYVLQPKDEEAVCYDYYAHLVSEENLSNVTVVTKAMIVSEQDGYSRQTEVQIKYWYKDNYIKYEAVLRKFFNGGINETVFSGFIVNNEDGYAILGINDKGQYVDITNEDTRLFTNSNKNDAYMVNVMSQMFRSGHNWFKVDEERYVLRQIEEATLAGLFESVYFAEESGAVQAITYSLVVSNQRITSTAMNIHAITSDESQELYITIESTLFAYNDTTFNVPEEVKSYTDNK